MSSGKVEPPYSFEPGAIYKIEVEVLEGKRWVTKSKGLPTLARMHNFEVILERVNGTERLLPVLGYARVRKKLPNGVWFGGCMASDHLAFVKAVVKYLEYCYANKIVPVSDGYSFGREKT